MFKLVCGAGNEDCESVKRLVFVYASAGCKLFDLSARKEVLEASRAAYVAMLSKDDLSIADIIALNDKIEKIDIELKQIYLDIDTYDSLIDYSTVTISYYEKGEYKEPTFFDNYADYITGFFVTIGKVILYLLPVAVLGGVGAVITIVCIKHHKNKKNANKSEEKKE